MMRKLLSLIVLLIFIPLTNNAQTYGKVEENMLKGIINISGKGTGFLVGRPVPDKEGKSKIYLVTNKHMIGQWSLVDTLIPDPSLVMFLYGKGSSAPIIPVQVNLVDKKGSLLPTVKVHPNPKIDIAVIDITPQLVAIKGLDLAFFDVSYLIPLDSITPQTYTGIGDQVFAIGYPAGITSSKTFRPIIKAGYISSSLSGDLTIYSNWVNRRKQKLKASAEGKFFLVDGLIIGGNSGGPIVRAKERKFRVIDGQFSYTKGEIPNLILGIVSYGMNNTGISVIYSSDHIIEVFEQFPLK